MTNTRGNKSIKTMEVKMPIVMLMVFNEWKENLLEKTIYYVIFLQFSSFFSLSFINRHYHSFAGISQNKNKKLKHNTIQSKRRRKNIFFNCVYLTRRKLINSDDFFFHFL